MLTKLRPAVISRANMPSPEEPILPPPLFYLKRDIPTIEYNDKHYDEIGIGGQGEIWKVTLGPIDYALKSFHPENEDSEEEIKFVRSLPSQENIIKVVALVGSRRYPWYSGYIMELLYTDFHQVIYDKSITYGWELKKLWFEQAQKALSVLHHYDIIHRDVKPGNFLLSADLKVLKIGDFGKACVRPNFPFNDDNFTDAYVAPEIIRGFELHRKRSDVYSFAIVMWEVFTRKPPYGPEVDCIKLAVKDGLRPYSVEPDFVMPKTEYYLNYTWECLLHTNPTKRPQIDELKLIKGED